GVELTLEHAHKVGEFSYSIGANMSWVKNELRSLNGGSELPGDKVMTSEGMPLNSFWGYKYLGIFANDIDALNYFKKNDPSLKLSTATFKGGDAIYQDVNQDGKIDTEDQMNIGNPFPMLTFGLNFSAEFYGVDVQLFFQGVYGNKIYNAVRLRTEGAGDECTLSTSMRNAWIGYNADREKMLNDEGLGWMMEWENRNGSIPNPAGASANMADNSRFLEDGSYLRLKNLTIGYTLPKKVTEKFFCKRLRFYMTASNLFTITKYSGYDPEVGGGVDYGNYPQSRTFIFGLNANF
ncbi:MAG: hypothetical protein J6Z06_06095, partial [Lachnospiraceae bacterium]|nr:hypothetical protein [Lachnospiraceae bacterium]